MKDIEFIAFHDVDAAHAFRRLYGGAIYIPEHDGSVLWYQPDRDGKLGQIDCDHDSTKSLELDGADLSIVDFIAFNDRRLVAAFYSRYGGWVVEAANRATLWFSPVYTLSQVEEHPFAGRVLSLDDEEDQQLADLKAWDAIAREIAWKLGRMVREHGGAKPTDQNGGRLLDNR